MLRWEENVRGYRLSLVRFGEGFAVAAVLLVLWCATTVMVYTISPQGDRPLTMSIWLGFMCVTSILPGVWAVRLLRNPPWVEIGLRGRGVCWWSRRGASQPEPVEASTFEVVALGVSLGGRVWDTSYRIDVVLADGPRVRVLDDWETGREETAKMIVARLNELLEAAASRSDNSPS